MRLELFVIGAALVLAACGDNLEPPSIIEVLANDTSLVAARLDGQAWQVLTPDELGRATFAAADAYALVAVCGRGDTAERVTAILAGPGDRTTWDLGCGAGAGAVVRFEADRRFDLYLGGDQPAGANLGNGEEITLAPGTHDLVLVARDRGPVLGPAFEIKRGLVLTAGTQTLRFAPQGRLEHREVAITAPGDGQIAPHGFLITAGGTRATIWSPEGASALVVPAAALIAGDRQYVGAVRDAGGSAHFTQAGDRIEPASGAVTVALPAPLVQLTTTRSPPSATWTHADRGWDRRTLTTKGGVRWRVEQHPGAADFDRDTLGFPDVADLPGAWTTWARDIGAIELELSRVDDARLRVVGASR